MPPTHNFSNKEPDFRMLGGIIGATKEFSTSINDGIYSSNIPKSNIPTSKIPTVEEQIKAQKRQEKISKVKHHTIKQERKEKDEPEGNNHIAVKASLILYPLIMFTILLSTGTIDISNIMTGDEKPIVVEELKQYYQKFADQSNDSWRTKYTGADLQSLLVIENTINTSDCPTLITMFDQNTKWLLRPQIAEKILEKNCI